MPIPTQAKIVKKGSSGPDQFEFSIAQALLELENNSDLKAQLRELYITKAKEIELLGKKVSLIDYTSGSQPRRCDKILRDALKIFLKKHENIIFDYLYLIKTLLG